LLPPAQSSHRGVITPISKAVARIDQRIRMRRWFHECAFEKLVQQSDQASHAEIGKRVR
jgi:hypothetical protein